MDRGAWRVTVHGVAESDMTEQLTMIIPDALKGKTRRNSSHYE